MKLDATAYFLRARDYVKMLSNILEPDILQEIYVATQEIRLECKVCELCYPPIGIMPLYTRIQFIISNTKEECNF